MTDHELILAYRTQRDENAFFTLVERHGDVVYSAALRQVREPAMADDITQAVFILLANKPPARDTHGSLSGWLIKAAHFCARDALKISRRRLRHEQQAARGWAAQAAPNDTGWHAVRSQLDGALAELGAKERSAIVLKYLQNQTLEQVGRSLGISKEGAHKRIQRGLSRLRRALRRRGVTLPTGALASALLARPADAAPATLKIRIANDAVKATWSAKTPGTVIAKGAWKMFVMAKVKAAALVVLAAAVSLPLAAWPLMNARAQSPSEAAQQVGVDVIMPGDTLCVGVSELTPGDAEAIKTVHVGTAGDVRLLYVGVVHVGGLDFAAAEKAIADAYRAAHLADEPAVTVNRLSTGRAARALAANDRVSVRVFELLSAGEWVTRVMPISGGGKVSLPYIGQIQLAGLEEAAAEGAIANKYRETQRLREPVISVYRLEEGQTVEPSTDPYTQIGPRLKK